MGKPSVCEIAQPHYELVCFGEGSLESGTVGNAGRVVDLDKVKGEEE